MSTVCNRCGGELLKKNSRLVCVNCGDFISQDGQTGQDGYSRRQLRKERERDRWKYYNKDTYSK
jgi:uncharacterized Zn finger protein (UPF0148 family)